MPFNLGISGTPVPSAAPAFAAAIVTGAVALGLAATDLSARAALRKDPVATISTPS